jgi:serine/threonine protein kinase/WD40 repeat protein
MAAALPSIETIFCDALEIANDDERAAFLDRATGGDSKLRQQVEALLEARLRAGHFLDSPAVPPTAAVEPSTPGEASGTHIGPYKLLERIGEGGMGEVWMAEQREPIRRTVALKIIKAGMDTRQVVARFEAERQALALMDHPNIARVLDGGTTSGGRPFFVMELVKGTPITRYCDAHRLTLRERLEVFLPVCQAIQHAHQKGIIHRDIKPANVLIAPYDGRPVPKIIDFGVAKAIGQRLTEHTLYTGFGAVVGTLEYMSPEQAELNNQDIDTRSDIYALGVMLYELLTGTTPISHERVTHAAFAEMLRAIREEEPPRPSTRLSKDEARRMKYEATHSSRHRLWPYSLFILHSSSFQELDWIVMKALEKDRNRRYETTSGLARDIEHYLHDEPVQACPPTAGYRLRKWVRRRRGPVIAVGLVALALVAGVIGTTWGLVGAERARGDLRGQQIKTLAAERDRTWQQALSHWKETRIARAARQPGQRWRSLEALAATVQALRSLGQLEANRAELRDDAIASLTRWDVRAVGRLSAAPRLPGPGVDPLGQHYAFAEAPSVVCWGQLADHQVIHRWRWEGNRCVVLGISPDGRYAIAICSNDAHDVQDCRVWDSVSGLEVLHHPTVSWQIAFRPDGKVLALVQADGSVALCELGTGRNLLSLPAGCMPEWLSYHPGGRYLAISSHAHDDAEVWDTAAGKLVLRLPGARYAGAALDWSPDGSVLAVGSNDYNIYLCAFPGGGIQAVLRGQEHVITNVAYHPSGRLLASTGWDHTTRLWCFSPVADVVIPGEILHGFSRDGRRLITGSREGVTLWEISDPRGCLHYLPYGNGPERGPWEIVFAPDSRLMASAGIEGVRLWDAATASPIAWVPSGWGYSLAFSPDGNELYTTGPGGVMRWSIVRERDGRALRVGPGTVLRATTTDGRSLRIAVDGTGHALLIGSGDRDVDVVPLADPDKARRLGIHEGLYAIALSPDGHRAASSGRSDGGGVYLWDVARVALVRRLPLEDSLGNHLGATFSPDGRTLVTGDRSRFGFWDVGSWELRASLPRGPRTLYSLVAFARDGGLLAVAQGLNRIELYSAATLRRLAAMEMLAGPASVTCISLSPDGTRLAAVTDYSVVVLWDLRRLRRELATLDLDWEMPPYPAAGHAAEPVEPLKMEVLPAKTTPR